MHLVWMAAWRPARRCIQINKTTTDILGLRHAFAVLATPPQLVTQSCDALLSIAQCTCRRKQGTPDTPRPISTTTPFRFQQASHRPRQIAPGAPSKLAFRRNDLRPYEVKVIFGPNPPPISLANTLLKVLHSRRVDGNLDIDLPSQIATQLKPYPGAIDDALDWLRREYLDEDAAILRRIEREEAGQGDEALIQRALNLGLYKPQSGLYGARLGEDGDIFGESQLQKLRRANELKAQQEQKELDEFIEQEHQAKEEKAGALETRKENGLEGMHCRCAVERMTDTYD